MPLRYDYQSILIFIINAVATSLFSLLPFNTQSNIDLTFFTCLPTYCAWNILSTAIMKSKESNDKLEVVSNAVTRGTLHHGKPVGTTRSIDGGKLH